jgi:phage terminase small subunit
VSARLARLRIAAAVKGGADPYITKGSMGQQVVGPLIELERRARLDADALARELGLTPMARKRMGLSGLGDELDQFLTEITTGR